MNTYKRKIQDYKSKYGEISNGYFEDRKSKFYCYLFNINNSHEAQDYINMIKKDNREARHVIFIYSVFENNELKVKFSDDGEPQGTGTRSIYDILMRDNITNVCIIIVRLFGGILLGAGPLSRAYLNSFRDATSSLYIDTIFKYKEYIFKTNYNNINTIKKCLEKYENDNLVIIENIDYNDIVKFSLKVEVEHFNEIISKINNIV